jgi:hypothetical protein
MKLKTTLVLIASLFLLSACGQKEAINPVNGQRATESATNEQHDIPKEASYDEHLDFEREYTPIVEEEMKKRFPATNPSDNPFEKFGTYYIDTSDKNMMKYVFLVDQEDAQEIKDLSTALKAKMGDHVEFKKSKYSQLELKAVSQEVVKMLQEKKLVGGWGVGVDVMKQKVKVEAYLDESAKSEILNKFGEDLVEIQMFTTRLGLAGYVVDKKEDSILVVDPKKRDKEVQVYAATWYSNTPSNIEIGNKVEVTVVNGPRPLMLQYPDRDVALEVKVIQNSKLEGAELAEFEVIQKAVVSEINRSTFVSK